jgi:predicted XRE-type DNA-binding protein
MKLDIGITAGKKLPKLSFVDIDRFISKITLGSENECWMWKGGKFSNGYGVFHLARKLVKAHRVSFQLFVNDIPDGWEICHRCDVKLCCNPAHLFLGDSNDNIQDMKRKGRNGSAHGSKHGQAKLTDEEVRKIRYLYSQGDLLQKEIAAQFGIQQQHVSDLVLNNNWKHLV